MYLWTLCAILHPCFITPTEDPDCTGAIIVLVKFNEAANTIAKDNVMGVSVLQIPEEYWKLCILFLHLKSLNGNF